MSLQNGGHVGVETRQGERLGRPGVINLASMESEQRPCTRDSSVSPNYSAVIAIALQSQRQEDTAAHYIYTCAVGGLYADSPTFMLLAYLVNW
jgi:hypothetical protein